ncbi:MULTISPECIES: TetR family transcriptional regulator [unclassified Streptomyces]|uniref:TetR family transcriptional regulator n=1 Tax=Streptomyces lonegramiae TaxID=3075524 RepID=A0ABU2XCL1_9ACTN|nr:TetR family transcriptional regulator [Streptomyces sp. DSM 41529]MDT0542860.1 TetR family transcriptional regulator [Streptomyces sp. DSM 41529]
MKQPGARAAAATGTPRPTGRPPLTERRKEATRLEIAHEAVRLFGERGVAATSGEEIARAAGISPRTLWRYFPSKEECVRPLLAAGLEAVARRLRDWPADRPLCDGIQWDLPSAAEPSEVPSAMRRLIGLLPGEPGLRAVWLQVHHDAEPVFTEIIAARTGADPADLLPRLKAVMLNGALRVAAEEWAGRSAEADGAADAEVFRRAVLKATEGLAI